MRGGELERNTGAKGDGNPRQQPTRAGPSTNPGPQAFEQGSPGPGGRRRWYRDLRGSARRPSTGDTSTGYSQRAMGDPAPSRSAMRQQPATPGHQATGSCGMRT